MTKDTEITAWKASGTYITFEKVGGLKVFTKDVGNPSASPDQTLLLLHGFPESSFSYHLVLNALAKHFDRVLLFDFPGYGFSDKPQRGYSYSLLQQADVALEVWKYFGVSGGHLLAHDMGDSVATELMARQVEKSLPDWFLAGFKSYTLTNGGMVLQFAQLRTMQKLLLTPFGKFLARLSTQRLFRHQIKSAHGTDTLSEAEISNLWQMHLVNNGRAITHRTITYLLDRKKYESVRWLPAMAQTQVPIHICWGYKDKVAPIAIARHLKDSVCPGATLTVMKEVGHFGQLGSPQVWAASMLSFFK